MNILYIFQYSSNISTLQGRFDQMLRRGVSTKGRKKPPLPRERRQSLSKKPRRVCRPQAANKVQPVFCGGVYVAKNTSRSASVEFVRFQRTNYARGRLQAFCPKRALPFLDSLKRMNPGAPRRGSTAYQKSLAEFAARRRQMKCNPFFAGACTWQKILLSLQVWNLFAHRRTNYARGRLQAFCQKRVLPFFDSFRWGGAAGPRPTFFISRGLTINFL